MKTLKQRCIELLMKDHYNVIKTEADAVIVFDVIENIVVDEDLENFISNDLCSFSSKKYAFNWFFDEENTGIISVDDIDFEINSDMIGKSIKDILLEGKENYIQVNDNIFLTYWL